MRSGANHGLLWLVALALLGSFVSLYYYLAVLKAIFVEPALSEVEQSNHLLLSPIEPDFLQRISLILLAGTVLVLGFLPGGLVTLIAACLAPLR
jgi:NADH:ubiquinone oxidoreductase subunit 2 (subunit N)